MADSNILHSLSTLVIEAFETQHSDIPVDSILGDAREGFRRLCSGQVDLACTSRPINAEELQICKRDGLGFVELPIAFDAIGVVVNAKNTWAKAMTVEQLRRLWSPQAEGRVMRWKQIRSDWPDVPIHLYGPGPGSGTYDYFTEAIVGMEGTSRRDFVRSKDHSVLVEKVVADKYALAFLGLPYYRHHVDRLRVVEVDDGDDSNGQGSQQPTMENVLQARYQPLSRPLLIYVSTHAAQRHGVRMFVEFYLSHVEQFATEAGCIPLPVEFYARVWGRFSRGRTGTVFGGDGARISVTMQYLYEMSLEDLMDIEIY